MKGGIDVGVFSKGTGNDRPAPILIPADTGKSALSFIEEELDAWHVALQAHDDRDGLSFKQEYFGRLRHVCSQMHDDARFSRALERSEFILHHWDLEDRNIMVRRDGEGTQGKWLISAVLDWDDAISMPSDPDSLSTCLALGRSGT